jgi:hypothetical protein
MGVIGVPAAEVAVVDFLLPFHLLAGYLELLHYCGVSPVRLLFDGPYFADSVFLCAGAEVGEEGVPFDFEDVGFVGI